MIILFILYNKKHKGYRLDNTTKMKKVAIAFLVGLTLVLHLFTACDGMDDNYSSNPNLRLDFSTDTLSFDTVFATVGSTTRQLMIYNRNNEPLNIESILLASGGNTGFRLNVDGRKGDAFNRIGILEKDSLYVFVEVTVDPSDADQPLLLEDSIVFTVNGIQQSVVLEAYGQNVNLYKGGHTFDTDTHLTSTRPYLVYDSLVVAPGATLSIAPGVTFYMHDKANLVVYGTLKSEGRQEAPVVFRGDRLDFILNDILPYDRTPGQWGGIFFKAESFDNVMQHTIVRNGTTGLTFLTSTPDRPKMTVNHSQITNMDGNLFSAINCNIEIANTELSNATGAVAALIGGDYRFTHCTLANYMSLRPRNDTILSLVLSNILPDKQPCSLKAVFENSIIDGSYKEELLLSPGGGAPFDYLFNACVLKTKEKGDAHYPQSILVKQSPSFRQTGGKGNKYCFDFRPDSATTAGVGKADISISRQYPVDRLGVDRLTSPNGPCMGAYEFVPHEEEE